MNQGRIWTVVNPGVGLPLLLGSVTVIAILVHYAVLSNTTWFPKYWNGATVAAPAAAAPAPAAPAAKK
ncbi:light-harvesting protein [Rhodopseudomonas parapalustris]